jgi:glutamate dehydrogenase/leucine dehydrogenase
VLEKLNQYKTKAPEIVFEWKDDETGAEGWVVINSLRGGAAGGGTRMRLGCTKDEVLSLAKTMEIKFTVAGPQIGGAKSGINFDPKDPRKQLVLNKWYKRVVPMLQNYYGTGGDKNVDEVKDVVPITEKYGLHHPQEGIVVGHYTPSIEQKKVQIYQLQKGVELDVKSAVLSPNPSKSYLVADLITGYGVSESVRHFYEIYKNQNLECKRAIIQGWGNVAGAAAYYLAQQGAKIVGIIDKDGGLISEDGYNLEDIKNLMETRNGNSLSHPNMLSFDEINEKIWKVKADIFIPAAASKIVQKSQIDNLCANGLEVISCGANVPFADAEVFYGEIAQYTDTKCSVVPDFIANCGMARVFAYLMQPSRVTLTEEAIFEDVSITIKNALHDCFRSSSDLVGLQKVALGIAMDKLM